MSKINDLEQEVKADVKEATEAVSAKNANKPWFKRLSLTTWIFIALALGVVAGLALQGTPDIATTYIKPLGTIFLNLIKMIVVPLVIFSMIAGVISLSDIKKVGAIGGKTIAYYLCTTACAIIIGLIIANVFNVGGGYTLTADELSYEAKAAPSFIETIVNIFPNHFVQPMSDASMLQIIVIALFFGFGILAAGKKAQPVADFVNGMSEVCIKIMHMIISIAPFGVFGLIAVSCSVFGHNAAWGNILLAFAMITMFLGALLALFSIDLKRTLACSSMSQIGFILFGVAVQALLAAVVLVVVALGLLARAFAMGLV